MTEDPTEVENWAKQRVLGSGGFGVVTLWKHKTNDEMIAIKKCRWGTDQLLTAKHKERWSKEVEIMQRLSHPNVVGTVAVPSELSAVLKSELPMLCMEFCCKGDLRQVLNRAENCCGLKESEVRSLISDVASAVKYLHFMKITHRDLKPENIVLQQAEPRVLYKLIDLGYAKELDKSSICTSFVGTLQYLAPELFMSQNYTCSVDYWSLGLVSHEVMTGVRPFLPNMPPVSWMNHVSGKSSDDISAYQASDGSIVYSKELFAQNHISSCLKYYMERWLKVCLEWDSRKRGRDFSKSRDGDIVVFQLIEEILDKMMLQVYDTVNYQTLSYEVDKSTAVNTLQRWIERDTGLSVEHQDLLLADGSNVDLEKEAWLCIPQETANKDAMLFVYKKGVLKVPEVTPLIPSSVSAMMQDPRSMVAYAYQIRAYAHAVFFLNQEQELSKAFRQAAIVKLLKLTNSSRHLCKEVATTSVQLTQVEAQHQFNDLALQFDQQQALKTATISASRVQQWLDSSSAIRTQLDKLKSVVTYLKARSESALKKSHNLGTNPYLTSAEHDNLSSLVDAGLKCYENLRRRPKDKRNEKSDSVEMVKVVYNCLKTRDKLLRDTNFNMYMQQVVSIQSDVEKLCVPLAACIGTIGRVQADLSRSARDRQADVWSQVTRTSQSGVDSLVASLHSLTADPTSLSVAQSSPCCVVDKVPSPPVKHSALPDVSNQKQLVDMPTDAIIHDNIALRYATQDRMNQSFLHCRSILNDHQSLDWNFMD